MKANPWTKIGQKQDESRTKMYECQTLDKNWTKAEWKPDKKYGC